jgi:hypothetical protein
LSKLSAKAGHAVPVLFTVRASLVSGVARAPTPPPPTRMLLRPGAPPPWSPGASPKFPSGGSPSRARAQAAVRGSAPRSRAPWTPLPPRASGPSFSSPSAFSATTSKFFTTWIFSFANMPSNLVSGWSGRNR